MTIDWNWFFAAFAQCAAALIAIIGAFIISRLLGESEKQEIHASIIEDLIIKYSDLVKRIGGRYFTWYDKQNIEYSSDLEKAIKNGDFQGLSDEEKLSKLFEIEPNLFGTPSCIKELDKLIKKFTPVTTQLGNRLSMVNQPLSINIPPKGLWDKIAEEREIINSLEIESSTLIDKFTKAKKDSISTTKNLIPIKNTIYILMIGIILTVVYPLHFMPLEINQTPKLTFQYEVFFSHIFSIKGLLLLLLSFVVEGLFIYFLWLIFKLEKKYDKLVKIDLEEKYFDIKSYSEYFNK